MFSPLGGPKKDEQDVDWIGDLKLFIDDNNLLLTKIMMPAVEKHKKYMNHANAYKIYIAPLTRCAEMYCKKFDLDNQEEIFPEEKLQELAQKICNQQKLFIEKGDYEKERTE